MDCSLPGSSVQGILQARILEWVAVPFSRVLHLTYVYMHPQKTHRIYFPELVNEYTGTYVEDQGLTSLDFSIISCDKNGQIEALFYYYPNPENPDVETGRYKMVGEVKDYSDGIVTVGFVGTEWVEKSQTYHILDFTAKIDIAQNTLTSDEYELKLIGSPYRYPLSTT